MIIIKDVAVVLVAATLTALLLLGAAHVPGGARVGAHLNAAAETAFREPFEDVVNRELDGLYYQQYREMMAVMVMLQVAEHARQARLKAISGADLRGWQVPLPRIADAAGSPASISPPQARYLLPSSAGLETSKRANGPLVFTLICFLLAAAWGFTRRE